MIFTDKINRKYFKKVIRKCPVCFHARAERLCTQRFHLYQGHCLPGGYDVVCCQQCGFVYADTSASQKEYNDYYNAFSKYESPKGPGGINPYETHKYNRITKELEKLLPDKNSAILDIGCAKGGLLITLKSRGFDNLTGLDPSKNCVEQVQSQGIKAIQGGIFKENFAKATLDQTFDCVVLSHILEHIYDLRTAIENALAYVKTGGLLYIEVPDASRYTRYYVAPYNYFELEHINHFDKHALHTFMSRYACKPLVSGEKDVRHSKVVYYPAVFCAYQKMETAHGRIKIVPHFEARENILRYIKMSHAADHWPELEELAASQEEIVVWGAGAYAMRLYQTSLLRKCRIKNFVDNDFKKQGACFDTGVKILSPKEVLPDFQGPIVVCSAVYNNEIVSEIEELGISNRIIVLK